MLFSFINQTSIGNSTSCSRTRYSYPWRFPFLILLIVVGIYAEPSENNHRHFYVKIAGPEGTSYEGGMFHAELYLPDEYPMVPPKVLFRTKIFHPNIDKLGTKFIKDQLFP